MPSVSSPRSSRFGAVFLILFGSVFAGMGFMALRESLKNSPGSFMAYAGPGVFIVVGLGIVAGGVYAFMAASGSAKLARQYPGQPWLHNKTWASGRIKDSNLKGMLFIGGFALFWNAIAWSVTGGMISSGELGKEPASYIVLLFPLVGLGLACAVGVQFLRWRKYGTSVFEMAEVPGVIGGTLGGVVLTKVNIIPEDGFTLTLKSIHEWTSGSGKNRTTHRETLWESEQVLDEEAMADDPTCSALPVFFTIPYDCRPTARLGGDSQDYWELTARAKAPGLDYKASFRVPVFRTENSSPDVQEASEADLAPGARRTPPPALSEIPGLTVRPDFSGAELLEFRPLRNVFFMLIPLIISAIFLAVAIYMIRSGTAPLFFPIVFGGFALLITYGILSSLLSRVRVLLYPDRLEIKKRTLGVARPSTIARSQIGSVDVKQAMSSGNTVFYNVIVQTVNGQSITIPTLIKGRRQAEAFAAHLHAPDNAQD